jgi:hypothetical protein
VVLYATLLIVGVFGVEWGQLGGAGGRRGNGDHGVYMFGGECMTARCEDSAKRNPSTTGMRKRTQSMGKVVEIAPTDFLTPCRETSFALILSC